MTGLIIEQMLRGDVAGCIEIAGEAGLEVWTVSGFETELSRADSIALVGRLSGVVVGFVLGRALEADRSAEIYNIGVRSRFLRSGIGRSLLAAFEAEASKSLSSKLWLEVRASNISAISFYLSQGFTRQFTRKAFYSNPSDDALVMGKNLAREPGIDKLTLDSG